MNSVSEFLANIEAGDSAAADRLLPLVYDELRKLAGHMLAHEQPGQTLQATALVHEAYVRLVGSGQAQNWDNRGHFFAAAAQAMRRILVENSRSKQRIRRGGHLQRSDLVDVPIDASSIQEDLIALDAALDRLEAVNPQAVQLVNLRYFAGLSIAESAELLCISSRTANRSWVFARAWLHREIESADGEPQES